MSKYKREQAFGVAFQPGVPQDELARTSREVQKCTSQGESGRGSNELSEFCNTNELVQYVFDRWAENGSGVIEFSVLDPLPYSMFLQWLAMKPVVLGDGSVLTSSTSKQCPLLMTREGEFVELCWFPGCWLPGHVDVFGFPACTNSNHQTISPQVKFIFPVAVERIMGSLPTSVSSWNLFLNKVKSYPEECFAEVGPLTVSFKEAPTGKLMGCKKMLGTLSQVLLCVGQNCYKILTGVPNKTLCQTCSSNSKPHAWKMYSKVEWMSRRLSKNYNPINFMSMEPKSEYWKHFKHTKAVVDQFLIANGITSLHQLVALEELKLSNGILGRVEVVGGRLAVINLKSICIPINFGTKGGEGETALTFNSYSAEVTPDHELTKFELDKLTWVAETAELIQLRSEANLMLSSAGIFNDIQIRAELSRNGNWWRVKKDENEIYITVQKATSLLLAVFPGQGKVVEFCWWKGCNKGFATSSEQLLCSQHQQDYFDLLKSWQSLPGFKAPESHTLVYTAGAPASIQSSIHPSIIIANTIEAALVNFYGLKNGIKGYGVPIAEKRKSMMKFLDNCTHTSGSIRLGSARRQLWVQSNRPPVSEQQWKKVCDDCFKFANEGTDKCAAHTRENFKLNEQLALRKLMKLGEMDDWNQATWLLIHKNIMPKLSRSPVQIGEDLAIRTSRTPLTVPIAIIHKTTVKYICNNFEAGCVSLPSETYAACIGCQRVVQYTVSLCSLLLNNVKTYLVLNRRGVLHATGKFETESMKSALKKFLPIISVKKVSGIQLIRSEQPTSCWETAHSWRTAYILFANIEATITGAPIRIINKMPRITRSNMRALCYLCQKHGLVVRKTGKIFLRGDDSTGSAAIENVKLEFEIKRIGCRYIVISLLLTDPRHFYFLSSNQESSIQMVSETPPEDVMNPRVYVAEDTLGQIYIGQNERRGAFLNMAKCHYDRETDETNFRLLELNEEDMKENKVVALLKHNRNLTIFTMETLFQMAISLSTQLGNNEERSRRLVNGLYSHASLPHEHWFLELQYIMVDRYNWTIEIVEQNQAGFIPLFEPSNSSKIGIRKLQLNPNYFSEHEEKLEKGILKLSNWQEEQSQVEEDGVEEEVEYGSESEDLDEFI